MPPPQVKGTVRSSEMAWTMPGLTLVLCSAQPISSRINSSTCRDSKTLAIETAFATVRGRVVKRIGFFSRPSFSRRSGMTRTFTIKSRGLSHSAVLYEIADKAKAASLTLLRVKLDAKDITALHGAGERRPIAAGCRHHLRRCAKHVVAVREVKVGFARDPRKKAGASAWPHGIPADMRQYEQIGRAHV